jgi:glutaminase
MPLAFAGASPVRTVAMPSPLEEYLADLHRRLADLDHGEVAAYIPELAKADPRWFGLCIVTMDGVAYAVGDTEARFTLQSISKPFVYATALTDRGPDAVLRKVGVEPSGDAFNSISLHPQSGAPRNPMINAGAIATTSLVDGDSAEAQWQRIESAIAGFVGRDVAVDDAVYRSESETGFRNRAIAWMLKNFGIIDGDAMASLENYFRQCSILVDCRDLAFMAATLANDGIHPGTGTRVLASAHVEQVLSVMSTCGMYDYAGSWMFDVGMPAKSGVGGGILAVVPGRFGIGVFSPRLDARGNSVRGIAACQRLSREFGLHAFARTGTPAMALGRVYTAGVAPSRREHTRDVRAFLHARAHRIRYFCLHGFLTVDGIDYVVRRMQAAAAETSSFILDLHEAIGISDSAARLLNAARLGFGDEGIAVVCSRVRDARALLAPLRRSARKDDRGFLVFEDNDLAVEWCENRLLAELAPPSVATRRMVDSPLFQGVPSSLLREVEALAQPRTYAAGERILAQGESGDGRVFFIESGEVSIVVPLASGTHQRIACLGPGMEFGEMALLGQTTRSASVFADSEVRCRVLEAARFDVVSEAAPQLRIAVLENLAREMASRLRGANQWIAALA